MSQRLPTLFINHGGGPCFFMDPPAHAPDLWEKLAAHLKGLDASLGVRPKAVLVISGHWEEPVPTVNAAERPPLLFDYYGFPEHTYRLTYPAPGDPALAERVRELLGAAGFASGTEAHRGLDHGVFVPFKLIYPEADVPVVQLSLIERFDPARHIALGKALAPLRDEGVLIVGSGLSYHNLRLMFSGVGDDDSIRFDEWLVEAVEGHERDDKLARWADAPGARQCHPRPEHLLPLMVAAGAGGEDPGRRIYADRLLGKAVSGFRFG